MAYAVTCKSCGARFSVANDLVQKRIGNEPLALRCKRCREPIRVTASHPPEPLPEPAASHARPKPPLKKQAAPTPEATTPAASPVAAAKVAKKPLPPRPPRERQDSAAAFTGLGPGLLPQRAEARGEVQHDLFEPPPPSDRGRAVDLSDSAASEPPSRLDSAPPLFDLTHTTPNTSKHEAAHEDVDFLLGLRGSPGTTAALQSPSLADLARKPPSEPPVPIHVEEPTETPAAVSLSKPTPTPSAAPAPVAAPRRKRPALLLAFAALGVGGVALASTFMHQPPKAAAPPPAAIVTAPVEAAREAPVAEVASAPVPEAAPTAPTLAPRSAARTAAKAKPNDTVASTAKTPEPAAEPATPTPRPAARPEPREPVGAGFDRGAAVTTLNTQAAQASRCRKDGDPSGTASITITFAPSGRVTSANLSGPPFAGTATGGCIASALRRARVPAFDGDPVTVSKTVVIQ